MNIVRRVIASRTRYYIIEEQGATVGLLKNLRKCKAFTTIHLKYSTSYFRFDTLYPLNFNLISLEHFDDIVSHKLYPKLISLD